GLRAPAAPPGCRAARCRSPGPTLTPRAIPRTPRPAASWPGRAARRRRCVDPGSDSARCLAPSPRAARPAPAPVPCVVLSVLAVVLYPPLVVLSAAKDLPTPPGRGCEILRDARTLAASSNTPHPPAP